MIHIVSGDMFDTPADIRVNTVNCVGVMGAGVAKLFRERYPAMHAAYQESCRKGEYTPGCVRGYRRQGRKWILNAATKNHWRQASRYIWVGQILPRLRRRIENEIANISPPGQTKLSITIPALGCGWGGLDWTVVQRMIIGHLSELNADIFVFEPRAPRVTSNKGT